MIFEFRWKEPTQEKAKPNRREPRCAYNDPTADEAIENVMRAMCKKGEADERYAEGNRKGRG